MNDMCLYTYVPTSIRGQIVGVLRVETAKKVSERAILEVKLIAMVAHLLCARCDEENVNSDGTGSNPKIAIEVLEAELDAVLAERDGYRGKVRELELDLCEVTTERDKAMWRLRRATSKSESASDQSSPQFRSSPTPGQKMQHVSRQSPMKTSGAVQEDAVLSDIAKLKSDLSEFKRIA